MKIFGGYVVWGYIDWEPLLVDLDKMQRAADRDLCKAMDEIKKKNAHDIEGWHIESDEFIVDVLKKAGYPKLAEKYEDYQHWWRYA